MPGAGSRPRLKAPAPGPRPVQPQPRLPAAATVSSRRSPFLAAAHKKNRYRITGIGFLFNTPEGVSVDYLPK